MKILLLIGGILGFGIGLLLSWAQESSGPTCLWRACLSAYLTALLLKWWGNAWRKSLIESIRERQTSLESANTAILSKANKS